MISPFGNLLGRTLGGYELVEEVGSGAMATVYKAYQPTLERWVALKVLHYRDDLAIKRFRREARAVALLRHRNILMVYEYGEQDHWPYIVMEYVSGGALSDQLPVKPPDWQQAVRLLTPIAEALQYAHQQGIIHRDVKPSNILMPQPDWPLLADFGLAKLTSAGPKSAAEESFTSSGVSLGTPAYVAPEQARGINIDHRADLYSFGVILFELVTGRLPFEYVNPNRMLLAHISDTPPRPRHLNSDCPGILETIILTALNKVPDQRYQDMGQVIDALRGLLDTNTAPMRSPTPRPAPPAPEIPTAAEVMETLNVSAPQPIKPARLLITGKNVTLDVPVRETLVIGRTHRDIIADVDLGPFGAAETGVSRRHARLFWRGDQWLIDDLGSLNGTFVNQARIKAGHPTPLKNGDVIRCSHLSMVFLV
jgi:serine/threonine protein kinase